ncbi:MAG: hypothetical protein K0U86_22595 [Planctomycetes bacterium]|nr:hypothetical protein [Planctomycetota bacterium]MCH9727699.1 hypothetical protein [Planctomycetota bacterium]MCH9776976.1 hypothetical protein [Planctomycetota bacterium]MCH9792430.1 hypothetical protein [Planctomycetota bacterium]
MRVVVVLLMLLPAQPALAQEIQKVVIRPDFGVYTVSKWKRDWPGCKYEDGVREGHLSIVKFNGAAAYRVDYVVGEIGPEKGGVGWRSPIQPSDVVELNYKVQFSEDFDWVKGGKLPGLCGGPKSVTGGKPANGTNGFSARLMWRANGRGEAYIYHMNQPGKYGESFSFPADFHFQRGKPVLVRLRVGMNTPHHADGTLDVWICDASTRKFRHVVSRSDMKWRATREIVVDSLRFETFYGGSNQSWAPRRSSFTLLSDISTQRIDSKQSSGR